MTEPSVFAKLRSSFTKKTPLFTKRTFLAFIASALTFNSRSTFSSMETSNGSTV